MKTDEYGIISFVFNTSTLNSFEALSIFDNTFANGSLFDIF